MPCTFGTSNLAVSRVQTRIPTQRMTTPLWQKQHHTSSNWNSRSPRRGDAPTERPYLTGTAAHPTQRSASSQHDDASKGRPYLSGDTYTGRPCLADASKGRPYPDDVSTGGPCLTSADTTPTQRSCTNKQFQMRTMTIKK